MRPPPHLEPAADGSDPEASHGTKTPSDLSAPALARAARGNLHVHFLTLRRSSAAQVRDDPRGFRWHSAVPHPWFRGVFSARPPGAETEGYIHDTVAYFRGRGVNAFSWWLDPALDVTPWARQLAPHGFRYDTRTPALAADLDTLPRPAPRAPVVRAVEDEDDLVLWTRTFVRSYGLPPDIAPPLSALLVSLGPEPPFRHYLGFEGNEPVATSTLFLGAGVAGLYNVATLPGFRRRGFGTAMTLIPLQHARRAGYRAGVLQSSEMALALYRRLGFRHVGRIAYFSWRDPGPCTTEARGTAAGRPA